MSTSVALINVSASTFRHLHHIIHVYFQASITSFDVFGLYFQSLDHIFRRPLITVGWGFSTSPSCASISMMGMLTLGSVVTEAVVSVFEVSVSAEKIES
jgi:hypothetical protein